MKAKLMLARFPGDYHEDPRTTTWIINTIRKIDKDERIGQLHMYVKSDTPITMTRNEAVDEALREKCDYLMMIDNDMQPDFQRARGQKLEPFYESAMDFLWRKETPALVASPYTGPNPYNNIYVFRYETDNNYRPEMYSLRQFTREEAAILSGIQQVPAIATGLVLMDMRLFERGGPEWFFYEWDDEGPQCTTCNQPRPGKRKRKGSTEDVSFSRNMSNLWRDVPGAGCYVNWSSWSGHIKKCICEPPEVTAPNHMGVLIEEMLAKAAAGGGNLRSEETVHILRGPVNEAGAVMDPNPQIWDETKSEEGCGAQEQPEDLQMAEVAADHYADLARDTLADLIPQGTDYDGRI